MLYNWASTLDSQCNVAWSERFNRDVKMSSFNLLNQRDSHDIFMKICADEFELPQILNESDKILGMTIGEYSDYILKLLKSKT